MTTRWNGISNDISNVLYRYEGAHREVVIDGGKQHRNELRGDTFDLHNDLIDLFHKLDEEGYITVHAGRSGWDRLPFRWRVRLDEAKLWYGRWKMRLTGRLWGCKCWHHRWDRWNTKDKPKCGQLPADFEPDPRKCPCRCHQIERDYLLEVREHWKLMDKHREVSLKLYNMEETHEPKPGLGGALLCRCPKPDFFCRKCKGIDPSHWENP